MKDWKIKGIYCYYTDVFLLDQSVFFSVALQKQFASIARQALHKERHQVKKQTQEKL